MAFGMSAASAALVGSIAAPVVGGLIGGSSGSQQSGTTTVSNDPWIGVQPYLNGTNGIYPNAGNWYRNGGTHVAPVDPWTYAAQQYGLTNAFSNANQGQGVANQANSDFYHAGQLGMQGVQQGINATNIGNNPAVQDQINALRNTLNTNAAQNYNLYTDPAIRADALSAGQYGSSRQGIAEGVAQGISNANLNNSLASGIANIENNAYNTGAGMFNNAMNTATNMQTNNLNYMGAGQSMANQPTTAMGNIGTFNQQQQQNINNQPYANLHDYAQIIQPTANVGGSQTSPYYTNPTSGALGGALMGSQIASNLGFGGSNAAYNAIPNGNASNMVNMTGFMNNPFGPQSTPTTW